MNKDSSSFYECTSVQCFCVCLFLLFVFALQAIHIVSAFIVFEDFLFFELEAIPFLVPAIRDEDESAKC